MPEMADLNAEKSKLLNKHKAERTDVEKKLKKAKGNMKQKFETELAEIEARQQEELDALLAQHGAAGSASSSSSSAPKEKAPEKIFKKRDWNGLSKKELEEACVERGIGKKGGKEDLIVKLLDFHNAQDKRMAEDPDLEAKLKLQEENRKKKEAEEEAEEEEEDSDESDDDSEDEADGEIIEVTAEEREKQIKREKVVRQAIRHCLREQGAFALDELPKVLEKVIKGFTPTIVGYTTLRKFAKSQPKKYMRFDRKENMLMPPKE